MIDRREALARMGLGTLALPGLAGAGQGQGQAQPKAAIRRPIPFNTTEADAILESLQIFPRDNPWNLDVSKWPLHPRSEQLIESIGGNKPLRYNPDMAFIIVPPDQKRVPVKIIDYPDESDPGPFPVPDNMPIEGWPKWYKSESKFANATLEDIQRGRLSTDGDRHAIVVDPANGKLHEFFRTFRKGNGWEAAQASTFDLRSNKLRPKDWTSADAAGLPLFPSIVRYDELHRGRINHALRVTIRKARRAYVHPATHAVNRLTDRNLPRMGERIRLKQDVDTSRFSQEARVILEALKTYGMMVADIGIEWAVSVAPDERIPVLNDDLRKITGSSFEVVLNPDGSGRDA